MSLSTLNKKPSSAKPSARVLKLAALKYSFFVIPMDVDKDRNESFSFGENASRSQMAEAFANHDGKGKLVASSPGAMLAHRVDPVVVEAMREKGMDVSRNQAKMLTRGMEEEAERIITMGCSVEEICTAPLLKNATDWGLEDPKGKPMEKVRQIRDEIEEGGKQLISEFAK